MHVMERIWKQPVEPGDFQIGIRRPSEFAKNKAVATLDGHHGHPGPHRGVSHAEWPKGDETAPT
jgi:hypothetical protein